MAKKQKYLRFNITITWNTKVTLEFTYPWVFVSYENLKFENSGIYDVYIHNSLLKVMVRFYNGFLQSRKNFSPETFSF